MLLLADYRFYIGLQNGGREDRVLFLRYTSGFLYAFFYMLNLDVATEFA